MPKPKEDIKKDYTLEKKIRTDQEKEQEKQGVPIYYEKLELSSTQKQRLSIEIFDELEEINKERMEDQRDELCEALDNQYEGKLQEDKRQQFNLNQNITKVKINRVVNLIMQAYMKQDPKYSFTPRPEFAKQGGQEVCDKQSDFIDDRLDNLPFRAAEGMVVHNAVLKNPGILKIYHEIKQEKRRREESYSGKKIAIMDRSTGQPAIDKKSGQVLYKQPGLIDFIRNWKDAEKRYPGYVNELLKGNDIEIVASYTETTYNDPFFKNVLPKNLYVRRATEGYEGLKTTKLIGEKITYSWWELIQKEREGDFYDIDQLAYEYKRDGKGKATKSEKKMKKFENKEYVVLENTYYGKLKPTDDEETKMVIWTEEQSRAVIGSILYPWHSIDCIYIPHYISKKKPGFYQVGMGEDLTDSNTAESFMLNFMLEGAYASNMITPIAGSKSPVHKQFLNKRWAHGVPMEAEAKDIRFLQEFMKPTDISGLMAIINFLKQGDDDITGVSSLMSGKHDPLDPQAPASKTIKLLEMSGVNIEDYIWAISPAFNEIGYVLLQMYHQIAKEGRKYSLRGERANFKNPFGEISRTELAARTNIQVQAYAFDFDKLNEKREDVAFMQLVRPEVLIQRNPEAVYFILKTIIKSWSPKWRNMVDKILPPLEEFRNKLMQTAVQAVGIYVSAKLEEAQNTGVKPEFAVEDLLPLISDMQAQLATAPDEEAIKKQEQEAGK